MFNITDFFLSYFSPWKSLMCDLCGGKNTLSIHKLFHIVSKLLYLVFLYVIVIYDIVYLVEFLLFGGR